MRYIREGSKKVIEYKSRLYVVWANMKQRCFNPKHKSFANYGGRGIQICPIWAKRNGYHEFIDWANTDNLWWYFGMGQRRYDPTAPKGVCTLDRVDNDGPYTPINCRWVDQKIQSNNTRKTKARLGRFKPKKVFSFKELHPQARSIVVMNMDGDEISRFEGIRQAAIALFGDTTKQAAIRYAATRSQKGTYRGYKFKILD